MPANAYQRSEMLFVVGLLYEHRGRHDRSRALLRDCIEEDPSQRRTAVLALRSLEGEVGLAKRKLEGNSKFGLRNAD